MPWIDSAKREINFKIVYYGPGLGGKTTSLQYVYEQSSPNRRSKIVQVASETERVIHFDFCFSSRSEIRGFQARFHLYTVPGPVFYDTSRIRVLKDVDGIIFVADSQEARWESNVESLEGLETNLAIHGYRLETVPMVLQYNKRDLPEILPIEDMDQILNPAGRMRFETIAARGIGVLDAFHAAAKLVIDKAHTG